MQARRSNGRAIRMTAGLLAVAACGDGAGRAVDGAAGPVERDSAGVRIVENPAEWPVRLQGDAELRIGALEGEDAYVFGQIAGVLVAPDGRMVVADQQAMELRVFAPDGTLLTRFGRRGDGPGELAGMSRLWLEGERVYVHDPSNRRLSSWTLAGEFEGSRAFGVGAGAPLGFMMERVDGGRYLNTNIIGCFGPPGSDAGPYYHRVLTDAAGITVDTLDVRPSGRSRAFMGERMCGFLDLPHGADTQLERGADGRWATGDGARYEIRVGRIRGERGPSASPGSLDGWFADELLIRRRHVARRFTDTDRRAHLESALAHQREDLRRDAEAALNALTYPSEWPAYYGLRFDADRRLWVLRTPRPNRGTRAGSRHYDVFDEGGRLLFEAVLPAAMAAAQADTVWGTGTDEDGVPFVARYRLVPAQ